MLEMKKGNHDTAGVLFQKAYKISPLFFLRELIGRSYLDGGRVDDAIIIYEKIINRYDLNRAYWPTFGVMTHFYLGRTYEEAGRYNDAIKQYETFLDIWKNADEGLRSVDDATQRLARLRAK